MTDDLVSQVCKTEFGAKMFELDLLNVSLAEKICKSMKKSGITRAELAKRSGVLEPVITGILDGSVTPGLPILTEIFLAMGRRLVVKTEAIS